MKPTDFFKKFKSWYLWGNLAAMALVVALACYGLKYWLGVYTHHGEAIEVPDLRQKSFKDAQHILCGLGLDVTVSDTGYVKTLSPDCILEQTPEPGARVKSGRMVTVIVNAAHSPMITLPDIIDNSSLREAMAKLSAMGFKVGKPEYIPGERDWVYGVTVRGRQVVAGDRISVDDVVTVQAGSGIRDESDSIEYVDIDDFEPVNEGDVDEFQVVTAPMPSEEPATE
ncbi:PASTA domain-containing protein [Prevotella sp. HCN-7019]|uniref:PASTA domain-containing protein n=1 Tax=Prevotella sp. HCN-7019 TaxID=3134668 RepID=UPI0030C3EDC9